MERQLADLKTFSEEAHLALWRLVDACSPDKVILLDHCRLPSGCAPTHVNIEFFKEGSSYCIGVKPAFCYTGDNAAIKALSKARMLPFDSYPDMAMFFREFPSPVADPAPARDTPVPAHSYDGKSTVVLHFILGDAIPRRDVLLIDPDADLTDII